MTRRRWVIVRWGKRWGCTSFLAAGRTSTAPLGKIHRISTKNERKAIRDKTGKTKVMLYKQL